MFAKAKGRHYKAPSGRRLGSVLAGGYAEIRGGGCSGNRSLS